ncbi:MAG: preprotein translocase subunit SecG [Defluviitaleaceae bacterium]|nr:preprotein translocase subunit SecG [Defluviitaleaceae bacterium]MCL2239746.1 preprotein translocase subunit SecG [Defluviitaleaceae bacterium]
MSVPFIIVSILYLIGCGALIAAILLQKKRSAGNMSSIAGMGNAADTYWDRNKSRTMEGSLERLTKIGGVLLGLLAIVLCLI